MKNNNETKTTQVTFAGYPIEKLTRVITHSGVFHADEVSAIALLEILADKKIDVLRTAKVDDVDDIVEVSSTTNGDNFISITIDIGMGRYDHHQHDGEGKPYYSDGTPMASLGLIARDISIDGKSLEELYPGFTKEILIPIEARDNGFTREDIKESPLGDIVKSFNPNWNSTASSDECFRKAVEIAKIILGNYLNRIAATLAAEEVVKAAPIINNVIILDEFAPWQTYIGDDIVGAVFPSNRGGWNIQLAPGVLKFENRGKFEFDEYAKSLTSFVHPAGFLAATNTKEDAITLTNYITPINWKQPTE